MSCVYGASMGVCPPPRTHIICIKAHTASVTNLLLLGKFWLHAQHNVGGTSLKYLVWVMGMQPYS